MQLTPEVYREVVDILVPFMGTESERKAQILMSLGLDHPLAAIIDFSGSPYTFTANLVQVLVNYGEISPNRQALWALLEAIAEQVGIERQAQIRALEPILNGSSPTSNVSAEVETGESNFSPAPDPNTLPDLPVEAAPEYLYLSLPAHDDWVRSVAYAPDGSLFVTASRDKTLRLWDARTGSLFLTLSGHTDPVIAVAWSPDGTRIASASDDTTIKIWEAKTGNLINTLDRHTDRVLGVAWSPDGMHLASASGDKTVRIWDAGSGISTHTLEGHTDWVRDVAWSPDGARLASAGYDKKIRVWDAHTGREIDILSGHQERVRVVDWSPDGKFIVSTSNDRTIRIWDMERYILLRTLIGHQGIVRGAAWSPDGALIASAANDGTLRIWDVATGVARVSLTNQDVRLLCLAWSPEGTHVATGATDNAVRVWDAAAAVAAAPPLQTSPVVDSSLYTLTGHKGWVTCLAFSPNGERLACTGANQPRIWSVSRRDTVLTFKSSSAYTNSVAYSPDGKKIVTTGQDNAVRVWDAIRGLKRLNQVFQGHRDATYSATFSPDGTKIASASKDQTIRLWEADSGRLLATFTGHGGSVHWVDYRPDGLRLVSGGSEGTIRIWDADTGLLLRTINGHTEGVRHVAYSPDGRLIVSASYDGLVKIWDAATGAERATMRGHTDAVRMANFSPDGRWIASAGRDNMIKVWPVPNPDAESGEVQAAYTLTGHTDSVRAVVWSPDGSLLASGGRDETIRLWASPVRVEVELPTAPAQNMASQGQQQRQEPAPEVQESLRYVRLGASATAWIAQKPYTLTLRVADSPFVGCDTLPLPPEADGLTAVIRGANTYFEGDSHIEVPLTGAFNYALPARAPYPGVATVTVEWFAGETRLDQVTEVEIPVQVAPEIPTQKALPAPSSATDMYARLPDLTLRIYTYPLPPDEKAGEMVRFYVAAYSPITALGVEEGWADLRDVPRALLAYVMDSIREATQHGADSTKAAARLREVGRFLWREILPKGMEKLWRRVNQAGSVRSVLILTDSEPFLPYELAIPEADGEPLAPLAARYHVTRWVEGLGTPRRPEFPIGKVLIESDAVWARAWQVSRNPLPADERGLGFAAPDADGLHIVRSGGDKLAMVTGNGDGGWETHIRRREAQIKAKTPLVTLALLGTARDHGFVGLETALQFVKYGATAVVGAWWSVPPSVDRVFWYAFYRAVSQQKALGESLSVARRAVQAMTWNPLHWLAYYGIGEPMATGYFPLEAVGYFNILRIYEQQGE